MEMNDCESNGSHGSSCIDPGGRFRCDSGGGNAVSRAKTQSLVLDSEKGELIKAPAKAAKKNVSEAKVKLALKNHSEAERRRRQRINGHLATLRDLVPCTDKMDKASLLAEVVNQVKSLRAIASESIRGLLIPTDSEELTVEPCGDNYENATVSFRALLCCKHRPDLYDDLRQAIGSLHAIKLVKMEISTFEDWLKIAFLFRRRRDEPENGSGSIYRALRGVIEKGSATPECSSRTAGPSRKRQKVSSFESSSSC